MKVLIDTNIFINLLRKDEDTLKTFSSMLDDYEFFYNPVIEAELLQGAKQKSIPSIEHILSLCSCVNIDCETGKIAGNFANQYLKSHSTITLDDYLIAASCEQHDLKLWTLNKKHFPMLKKSLI